MQKYDENYSNSSILMLMHVSLCAFIEMVAYKHKLVSKIRKK